MKQKRELSEKYFLKTFGCQMNIADSERIANALLNKGLIKIENTKDADLIIINSCIVRESAENRVYGLVNNLSKLPNKKIIITGCLAGWALNDKTGKNLKVLKRKTKNKADVVLTDDLADFSVKPLLLNKEIAWIPISNGCNNFCSYCIVPYARGREISRPFSKIIADTKSRVKNGFSKATLLGQNVNSYGTDLIKKGDDDKKTILVKQMGKKRVPALFPHLLESVAKISGIEFVDFMSSNPWDFSDDLIKVISKNKNITRTIHLPVQSGDNQVLKMMNRQYTANDYLKLIKRIKKEIADVSFTTDIIVGFPGETKKQFENTIDLCKKVNFKKAYINKYSPRSGTPSTKFKDNVSPVEKKKRWQRLEKLINKN